ncbi:tRNA 2-selenouridine synthase [Nitrosomonas cryotolerans]|uniref:tRNA 2-selenouridine synthase n=1 Tax=Nitrosomonas cryotolerans ATCC 49181 TaxID=1131553 RepID=A0A1N6JDG9_9PROT|nr:tRNA 2-selenouridine(34) synthase MnmH [Nitrosomonas cryotolerans]SFP49608.1 tRNA 2-selenouridine synthase [Nitrosomonas cryotolerans]SIO42414.1 tRNA 2-selenouridine synthase [Nitrosomonas cryotolerans ATCC 49181]
MGFIVIPDYLVTAENFRNLFLCHTAFIDVRAEDEFAKGSFPYATNIPILNNRERHLVGTCYKQRGQLAAVKLGHELVCGRLKAERIRSWCELAAVNADIHLYCWRGGMRSNLARQWMSEAGVEVPLIAGGYKALRRSLIGVLDEVASNVSIIRIGGKTGVAKTRLINQLANSVDLEKHANHRGSSFGRMIDHQPTQSSFEHALAIDLLHTILATPRKQVLFVEDESQNIGAVGIPMAFFDAMRRSPLALVDMSLEFRVQRVLQEYVINMLDSFEMACSEHGFVRFSNYLSESLLRMQKRLGLERYNYVATLLEHAIRTQLSSGSILGHEAWITVLLNEYYDPMYEYQIHKNKEWIVFRGNYTEVLDWARQK